MRLASPTRAASGLRAAAATTAAIGALLSLHFASTRASAQAASVVTGVVVSAEGLPVQAALVRVLWRDRGNRLRDRTTRSDEAGAFRLDALVAGSYALTVRRIGFEPYDATLALARGENWQLLVELVDLPQALEPTTVSALAARLGKMSDFERRRGGGTGTFFTRADIERRRPRAMSDLLRVLPGASLTGAESGERGVRFRGMGSITQACSPDFYVDGAYVPNFGIDVIPPADVEGVEVYRGPAQTPAAFRASNTPCGVIVIWTRDPGRG